MMQTIEDIRDMDRNTLNLIGFPLAAKLNGKIVSLSMREAFNQMRQAQSNGIDGYNDLMAELQAIEGTTQFFDDAGIAPSESTEEQLAKYLGARKLLAEAGVRVSPISENFGYIMTRAGQKGSVADDDVKKLAEQSGMSEAVVVETFKAKGEKELADTKERILKAMEIISKIEPNEADTPADWKELVLASVQSGRKSAIKIANDTTDAFANLMLLKALEDTL